MIEIDPVHFSEHIITEITEKVCSNINRGTVSEATADLLRQPFVIIIVPRVDRDRCRFNGL